jgi:hypothetical protein
VSRVPARAALKGEVAMAIRLSESEELRKQVALDGPVEVHLGLDVALEDTTRAVRDNLWRFQIGFPLIAGEGTQRPAPWPGSLMTLNLSIEIGWSDVASIHSRARSTADGSRKNERLESSSKPMSKPQRQSRTRGLTAETSRWSNNSVGSGRNQGPGRYGACPSGSTSWHLGRRIL